MKLESNVARLGLALLTLGLFAPGQARAEEKAQIKVSPASPTTNDDVTLTLSGVWSDSCAPGRVVSPKLQRSGSDVGVSFNYNALSGACATVLTPWSLDLSLGRLGAGTYTVDVSLLKSLLPASSIGKATFTVGLPQDTIVYAPGFQSADGSFVSRLPIFNNGPNRVVVQPLAAYDALGERDLSTSPAVELAPGASAEVDTRDVRGGSVQMMALRTPSRVAFRPAFERLGDEVATGGRRSLGRVALPLFRDLFPKGSTAVAGDVKLFGDEGCTVAARRVNLTLFNGGAETANVDVVVTEAGSTSGTALYTQRYQIAPTTTVQINGLPLQTSDVCRGEGSVWFSMTADQPFLSYVSTATNETAPGTIPYEIYPSRLEY